MINLKRIAIVLLLLLAACAQAPQRNAGQTSNLDSGAEDLSEQTELKLPELELSSQLLYQFLLGDVALQRGQMELATLTYIELAKSTRDPRVVRQAAHMAFETRQMDKVLEAASLWQELEPKSLRAKRMLAGMLLNSGKLDEARPHLIDLMTADPKNTADSFMQVYSMLARYPDKAAAYDLMHELAAPYPRVAEAHWALAQLAEASGKHGIAIEESRQASLLRPEWDRAVLLQVQLQQREMPQRALTLLQKYLAAYPDNKDIRLIYARMLTEQKQHSEARTQFQVLLDANPGNADLAFAVALLSLEVGELDRAEQELRRALDNGKKDENAVYYYLGQLSEAKHADEEALRSYGKVQGGEYAFSAHLRTAYLLNKAGQPENALLQLRQATAQNEQQRAQLVLIEAKILRDSKKLEAAYKVLQQGLKTLPDHPDLLYEMGMLADQIGQHETFEQMMRKLIHIQPDYAHGYNALGYSLLDRNERLAEGMQLVERAYLLAPDDAAIIDSVGWGHYRLGNLPKSVEFLRRAYLANPDPEIAAHLGEVLWMQGEKEEAKKIWQQAMQAHSDNTILMNVVKKFLP